MKAPAFWRAQRPNMAARLLQPCGALFGALVGQRMRRPGAQVAVPVITVGNFTAGGAGKTPIAQALARRLIEAGERPAFVSRGFDDEALLLAAVAPTFVGRDRAAAALRAIEEARASVLVLDDGLQSRRIEPDLAIAVVDGASGLGNGLCLPAGPLRAPLLAQLPHVQALVVMGPGEAGEKVAGIAQKSGVAILRAKLEPDARARALAGRRIVAFAGIGLPEKFFRTLEDIGAQVVARRAFPDHHAFRASELGELGALARKNHATLATTLKDAARLGANLDDESFALDGEARASIVRVDAVFEDETAADRLFTPLFLHPQNSR
ncbi:MAG: tetraacyldisaccharide 4'-kinase [Rhodoblastus sp.]